MGAKRFTRKLFLQKLLEKYITVEVLLLKTLAVR